MVDEPESQASHNHARPLPREESWQLAACVAELSDVQAPLADGLRVMASEASGKRLKATLNELADIVERGTPLVEALGQVGSQLPPALRGIVTAASRTGRLATALNEWIDQQQRQQELWRSTWSAVSYPLLVIAVSVLTTMTLPLFVLNLFQENSKPSLFFEVPTITLTMFAIGRALPSIFLFSVVAIVAITIVVWRMEPGRRVAWFSALPFIGKLWYWSGVAELSRLLAAFLECQMTLPDACELASESVANLRLKKVAGTLASGIRAGQRLSELVASRRLLPTSTTPFLLWGENVQMLPEAFRVIAEMFEQRVEQRASWLKSILPLCAFLFVSMSVLMFVFACLLPLYRSLLLFSDF